MKRVSILAAVIMALLSNPCRAGLIVSYDFDGNANDLSGNGNNGTIVGSPSFIAGPYGQAIDFQNPAGNVSATQYVTIPNSADITGLQLSSFTFAILYNSTDTTENSGRLFGHTLEAPEGEAIIYNYNAGGVANSYVQLRGTSGTISTENISSGYTTDGKWHWGIVVVDRVAGTITQYVDDNIVAATSIGNLGSIPFSNLTLGMVSGQPEYGARQTAVGDFQLYSTALSPSEVASLVETGSAVPEPSSLCLALLALGSFITYGAVRRRSQF